MLDFHRKIEITAILFRINMWMTNSQEGSSVLLETILSQDIKLQSKNCNQY